MSATLGFVATLAEMEQFYRGDKAGQIIELMNKTNDIMDDVPWMEANQSDGHLTRIRTGLPAVYWRRLYQGTPPAKSQWSQVKEGCGILEAIMELDVEEIRLYGDRDRSFRMSEGIAFAEAMRQKVALTLFYGDSNRNPDEFNGLAMRYPASDAENVLDAGGRAGGCTSLWLVSWGPQSVHGISIPRAAAAAVPTKISRPTWRRTRTAANIRSRATNTTGAAVWPYATGAGWCASPTCPWPRWASARARKVSWICRS